MKLVVGIINLLCLLQLVLSMNINPQISALLQSGLFGQTAQTFGNFAANTNQRPPDGLNYNRPNSLSPDYGATSTLGNLCSKSCEDKNPVLCLYKRSECNRGVLGIVFQTMCPKTCGLCPRCPLYARPCVPAEKCQDKAGSCHVMASRCNAAGTLGVYVKQNCPVSCGQCRPCPKEPERPKPIRCLRNCKDDHNDCPYWAKSEQNYCSKDSGYEEWMSQNCRKSCEICKPCPTRDSINSRNFGPPPARTATTEGKPSFPDELPSLSKELPSVPDEFSPDELTSIPDGLPPLPDELRKLLEEAAKEEVSPTASYQMTTTVPTTTPSIIVPTVSTTTQKIDSFEPDDSHLPGFRPPGYPMSTPDKMEYVSPDNNKLPGFHPPGLPMKSASSTDKIDPMVPENNKLPGFHPPGLPMRSIYPNEPMPETDMNMKPGPDYVPDMMKVIDPTSSEKMYENNSPRDHFQMQPESHQPEENMMMMKPMHPGKEHIKEMKPMSGRYNRTENSGSMKPMHPQGSRPMYGMRPKDRMDGSKPRKPMHSSGGRPMHGMRPNKDHYNQMGGHESKKPMRPYGGKPMKGMRPTGYPMKPESNSYEDPCDMYKDMTSDSMMDQCVNAHNYYRCLHGAGPLEFDEKLATSAQMYAEILATEGVTMETLKEVMMELAEDDDVMYMMMMQEPQALRDEEMMLEKMIEEEMLGEMNMMKPKMENMDMMEGTGMMEGKDMMESTGMMEGKNMIGGTDMMGGQGVMGGKNMMGENMMEGKDMTDEEVEEELLRGVLEKLEQTQNMEKMESMEGMTMNKEESEIMEQSMMKQMEMMESSNSDKMEEEMMQKNMLGQTDIRSPSSYASRQTEMMDIGVNVGISVNDNKKYGIYEAVIDWYAERLTYMYGGQSGKMNSGRYSQLVWKNTTKVGCGMQKMGSKMVVVAHYYTKGNIPERYEDNVSDMSKGCSNHCSMGSCASIKSSTACNCIQANPITTVPVCRKQCVITCNKPTYHEGPWQQSCQGTNLCTCSNTPNESSGYLAGAWCK